MVPREEETAHVNILADDVRGGWMSFCRTQS